MQQAAQGMSIGGRFCDDTAVDYDALIVPTGERRIATLSGEATPNADARLYPRRNAGAASR